jgi:indolepyruvate ferredoxin oxidoreductase
MVQFMPGRHTEGCTQMGGEGANWIGEAPFSTRKHVFQNIGDGTYNHSGLMAIRAAVASGVNITYKILYNDAVAMTGGQSNDGNLSVPLIAQQMRSIGVERIAVVSDEPGKYPSDAGFPARVSFHHRDDLQDVQKSFIDVAGTSILIYDQTCAAEKRRRRKRGSFPDPNKRVFINELVCEGCGDCGVKSNCVAVAPVETPFGRKRQIDQSACNKDYSCLKGFCPSFVTVEGGELIKGIEARALPRDGLFAVVPEPGLPDLARPWSILVTGIGGTGVITIGHILGMAAHIEGKGSAMIDMVGLSQKNGAVVTHLKIARSPGDISAVRIAEGGADLILGCDLVTSASERVLAVASEERTNAIVNTHETMPAQFTYTADLRLPGERMQVKIASRVKKGGSSTVDATRIATALLGDTIATNLFTLGFAYQKGLVPISGEAIEQAIRINGAAVKMNLEAFEWGRRTAHDEKAVEAILGGTDKPAQEETLDEMIARRVSFLTDYQDEVYAERYRYFVDDVRRREAAVKKSSTGLTEAVARYLFKLMAYKDEYEVARLYTDGSFAKALGKRFSGGRLTFHLSPPVLARRDPSTGEARKTAFGPWMMTAFRILAKFKGLRGTAFDIFGRTAERRIERSLIEDYRARIGELLAGLSPANLPLAVEIASIPEHIRGYGHVKMRHLEIAKDREDELVERWRSGKIGAPAALAAE